MHCKCINRICSVRNLQSQYTTVIAHQTKIGWINLLCGKLTKAWCTLYDEYNNQSPQPNTQRTATQWLNQVIHLLIQYTRDLWRVRCKLKLQRRLTCTDSRYRDLLNQAYEIIKIGNTKIPPNLRSIYCVTQEQIKTWSTENLMKWIQTWNLAQECEIPTVPALRQRKIHEFYR